MAFIKYEEEIEEEIVYTGEFKNPAGRLSEEKAKKEIFAMMEKEGITIDNPEDYRIEFLGTDEPDEDLYVNPTTNIRVIHKVKKEVPYEVEREEIFSTTMDTYLLRSEEESRNILRGLMSEAGVEVKDDDILEISYSGFDDEDEDLYYNPLTKVSVYKVTKTKVIEDKKDNKKQANREILENILDELYSLKKELNENINKMDTINKIYSLSLDEKIKNKEEIYNSKEEKEEVSKIDIEDATDSIDDRIKEVQARLKSLVKEYEDLYKELEKLTKKEDEFIDSNTLTEEEIEKFKSTSNVEKREVNRKSVEVRRAITENQKELEELKKEKEVLNSDAFKAAALGLTIEEYNEITDTLQKRKIFNAILEAKGLTDIVEKPYKERTAEEKALIKEAKEEMIEEIGKLRSEDNLSVMDAINALYDIEVEMSQGDHPRVLKVTSKDFESLNGEVNVLPEKVVTHDKDEEIDYIPGEIPEDMKDEEERKEIVFAGVKHPGMDIAASIQRDFGKDIRSNMDDYDVEIIIDPETNEERYEVYQVADSKEIVPYRQNDDIKTEIVPTTITVNEEERNNDNRERIVIYDVGEDNDKYVKRAVINRFNLEPIGPEMLIEGIPCVRIDEEDYNYVIGNADNDYSPYFVDEISINDIVDDDLDYDSIVDGIFDDDQDEEEDNLVLDDSIGDSSDNDEDIDQVDNSPHITIYRDLNDNSQAYATKEDLNKFGIGAPSGLTIIDGNNCYPISSDALQIIEHVASQSDNPIIIDYKDVSIKKHERPHPQKIIEKLTEGLEIHTKDTKRYQASNIKVADSFKKELQSGNVLYNIAHFAVAGIKGLSALIMKISGKLMLSARAKDTVKELEKRVNELTEEELEVLFEEYKGSYLKQDMNTQIISMILPRLKAFGLEKVSTLNANNKIHYSNLFISLRRIDIINEQLKDSNLSPAIRTQLENELEELYHSSAILVRKIEENRKQANDLLSGGVHGLEEDYKATLTKLSYVGKRFAAVENFDTELQAELGKYGQGLNSSMAEGDDRGIVENFINLEKTYAENTAIKEGRVMSRSVGKKYYSPLVEEFDYRDDPFIRDILITFALGSAVVSAVNSVQVHAFQSQELLSKHQADIDAVNAHNDAVMATVDKTASSLHADGDALQEGMAVQAHEDVLATGNVLEREALDMSGWSFNDLYHATDSANHEFYNGFYQRISSDINDVTSQYASGTLTQAQALQQMADIASSSHQTLVDVSNEALTILRDYAATHPQFDLTAIEESMQYIVEHPDAITNMNQASLDVMTSAEALSGLSIEHATALSSLPEDMLSTLVCAAGATALAAKVANMAENKYGNREYDNSVTSMMDKYLHGNEEEEQQEQEQTMTR